MDMQVKLHTAGDGYWSNVSQVVQVTDIKIGYVSDELDFGELRVYFDTKTWDIRNDGLIYTDSMFLRELRMWLKQHGLASEDVDYSEQGMQGRNYVSLDIGKEFLTSWAKLHKTTVKQLLDEFEAQYE